MVDHFAGREAVAAALRAELVGPDPRGEPLDTTAPIVFDQQKDSYGPWTEKHTGEEIISRDTPTMRYGTGVLYPWHPGSDHGAKEVLEPADLPGSEGSEADFGDRAAPSKEAGREEARRTAKAGRVAGGQQAEPEGYVLAGANEYRPSSIAISFLLDCEIPERLKVVFTGARYVPLAVQVGGKDSRGFWVRRPVEATWEPEVSLLSGSVPGHHKERVLLDDTDGKELVVEFFAVTRPQAPGQSLVTLGISNRSKGNADQCGLFQVGLSVEAENDLGECGVLPYPEAQVTARDDEEESLNLLYRHHRTYAVGHGCAADWPDATEGASGNVGRVEAKVLPEYETRSVTPDIKDVDGNEVKVHMVPLAGLVDEDDGTASLGRLVEAYEEWISLKRTEADTLSGANKAAAERHLSLCEEMAGRMRVGLNRLVSDATVRRAFQLANLAMLQQQIRQGTELRRPDWNKTTGRFEFPSPSDYDLLAPPEGRGYWRPFQIAFILATLCSAVDPEDPDREVVDLLFFPTGGGKTEAYLGLIALTLYHRRLLDPNDSGTHVLMRYTLRLLTGQQFQRASSLMCAMEIERQKSPEELGSEPFRIGIWVGANTTPNTNRQALAVLKALDKKKGDAVNQFVVIRCPWCSAQVGPVEKPPGSRSAPGVIGYENVAQTVKIRCPDIRCDFASGLPVEVIDEEIYARPPSMLIATVDKFARLAWISETRSLFGIGEDGSRISSPPGLIIQDELHLISGPLGSMVGLYETLVEHLCTGSAKPKIVSSTATIRRFDQQVLDLFARDRAAIFPPHGLEAAESFFASTARNEAGEPLPGRRYMGVFAPGLGSHQTAQVRTYTALLQAAKDGESSTEQGATDPWWTLMVFFLSMRELGTALSLLTQDIPARFGVLRQRMGKKWNEMRNPWKSIELTGRLDSEEVHRAVEDLSVRQGGSERPVDVCLATNIIEVGVDIDRLSLLVLAGQPKTTSQYIQVSGRIGRRWWERPGLVVTVYGPTKPRDRSHYERFRSYHERLYAQVEPTSVTPFSPPSLERAAHALLIAYVRQKQRMGSAATPLPYPDAEVKNATALLTQRVARVDPGEAQSLAKVLARRAREWRTWQRSYWERQEDGSDYLMRRYGEYVDAQNRNTTWPVPNSLRNVDAECSTVITSLYLHDDQDSGTLAGNGGQDG